MNLLYFAWVRDRIGVDEEQRDLPAHVKTVADILPWLSGLSPQHAAALAEPEALRIAVNHDYAGPGHSVTNDDEVAIFPPVTGGGSVLRCRVQAEPFDIGAEHDALIGNRTDVGAVVTFTGLVRDWRQTDDRPTGVTAMTLEHYPPMVDRQMRKIADEAQARWPLIGGTIVHRYGRLEPGDAIVLVMVASAHRDAAFQAAEFLMDWLKTKAPFWKREQGPDGENWVSAKDGDGQAAARWLRTAPS